MRQALVAGLLLWSLGSYGLAQSTELKDYTASYRANANGLAATATRRLETLGADSYRLSNSLEATLAGTTLASLQQTSEFHIESQRLIPQSFSSQLRGASRESLAIAYNWEASAAISTEDEESWRLDLHDGVFDQLSYQPALRLALLDRSDTPTPLEFEIIDADEIDRHEYRIAGYEMLTTPLGELNTLKLERVRAAGDERVTEIWLATDWDLMLTRLEQVNRSGLHIVLELQSATLGGEEVRPDN